MRPLSRVLTVDDDFEFRQVIAEALQQQGWEVRGAATGTEALGLLRSWRPDVIVLDLMLPRLNGWAFHAEAERQHTLEGIPIRFTPGFPQVRPHLAGLLGLMRASSPS